MRHQFGWDLPPGVSTRDIEDAQAITCGIWISEENGYPQECGKEATTEDEFGNPVCEEHAGTKYQSDGLPPQVEKL